MTIVRARILPGALDRLLRAYRAAQGSEPCGVLLGERETLDSGPQGSGPQDSGPQDSGPPDPGGEGASAGGAEAIHILAVSALPNVHERPQEAFLMDPDHLLEARRGARADGLEVVGVWHGHPLGPATLSSADARLIAESAVAPVGGAGLLVILGRGSGRGSEAPPVVRAFAHSPRGAREIRLEALWRQPA